MLVFIISCIAGFRPTNWLLVPVAVAFMIAIAVVFAALGVAIGSSIQDMQGFQLIMNFMVMPIFFLSGALFPLAGHGMILTVITRLDPLSYGIDGIRAVLLQSSQFQPAFAVSTSAIVLAAVGSTLLVIGAWRFSKIEI
jgi:ABC-2 type transport system permease protein